MTFTKYARWATASRTCSPSGLLDTITPGIRSSWPEPAEGVSALVPKCHEGCNRIKHINDAFCDMLWPHTWISKSLSQRFENLRFFTCAVDSTALVQPALVQPLPAKPAIAPWLVQTSQSLWCGKIEPCSNLPLVCEWKELSSSLLAKCLIQLTTSAGFAPFPHVQWLNCWLLSEKGFFLCLPKHPEELGSEL